MKFHGSIVKKTRQEQGHKQYYFAQLTGISQPHLSKIEKEKAFPTLLELIAISVTLNKSLGHFVN
ncbi:MAG: helix-turn-helix transcriptional regulator [Arcicella sp.]|nr:helix-turn-helix transcriptional regulator [Arcicella sp.]